MPTPVAPLQIWLPSECDPASPHPLHEDCAMIDPFEDAPPSGPQLTDYDRSHIKLYMRLLDASADGADWREAVEVLFGIDPEREPDRARLIHDSHLERALWMTRTGYRQLLQHSGNRL